jgi:hypothetical protein
MRVEHTIVLNGLTKSHYQWVKILVSMTMSNFEPYNFFGVNPEQGEFSHMPFVNEMAGILVGLLEQTMHGTQKHNDKFDI